MSSISLPIFSHRVRSVFFAAAFAFCAFPALAQTDTLPSSVDVRLVQGTTPAELLIQVKLHSTAPFGGIFSALTVTVRYDAASGAALGAGTSFCPAWSSFSPSPVVVDNGIAYRTYNGFGINRLEDAPFDGGCGLSLPVETWFTISTIPVGGNICTAFTLGNDAFTNAQNRDYYISMAGTNVTGEVEGGPVNGGNCAADCLGVPGGNAMPGTACDDGNASTTDDTWSVDCVCTGTAVVYDCPGLEANIGDACDDGNAETVDDMVTTDCVCAGTIVYDCPGLEANIGDACDDGNANTVDDVVTADCVCAGTMAYDCPGLEANIGDACDDGNANTVDDVVTADCVCAGTMVYDCPDLEANIGDACDDGNANTVDDVVTTDCVCAGTMVYDCPGLEANIGDACDDDNANTVDDVVTADCVCAGTMVYDCPGLEANIGDACDDDNANTVDDVVTSDCVCAGTVVYDCPDLEANIGDSCDDGNAATEEDVITADCSCEGTLTEAVTDLQGGLPVSLSVYPNPNTNGLVHIRMEGMNPGLRSAQVIVRDAAGRTIAKESAQVAHGELDHRMDLSRQVTQGLYLVEVLCGGQHFLARLTVQ